MEYSYLRVKTDTGERATQLSSVPLTIGRHESNRLVVDDSQASRFHCVVEKGAEGYILRDLQSRNGTLVNGQRVINMALKSGDVIAIGAVQLTFMVHSVSPSLSGKPAQPAPEQLDDLEVLDDLELAPAAPPPPEPAAPKVAQASPIFALKRIADAMLERPFEIQEVFLVNGRGHILHNWREARDEPGDVTLVMHLILLICFRSHATDIHLEPREADYLLRIRMDGNLLDIVAFSRDLGTRLMAQVKILCELDTTQKHIVQEGHFAARAPAVAKQGATRTAEGQRRVDYRVSLVPSLHGQKLVVRIFDAANAPLLLKDLDLPPSVSAPISEELTKDAGLILVCGPTGSGKTTTLYSLLRSCGSTFRNIVTIEDPVEVQIEGTTQLPVDDANGKSFAALLRSVLRQDPDVIMVGEIRDPETARIALQAAMTGHLVLSTIHTRDTVGTVFRLLDLGIEPYMVSQGLQLILAQRLVRTLCLACRRAFSLTPEDRKRMGAAGEKVDKIYAPVGCPKCLGTGYYSRRALFEFLSVGDNLRNQIMKNPSITELQNHVGEDFIRLAAHGYQLVAEGLTSIDEVDRAVGR